MSGEARGAKSAVGRAAWSPERDLPWRRAESLARIGRRARVPAFDFVRRSALWRRLPATRRAAFRVESLDWAVCQAIHGESLALATARAVARSAAPAPVRAEAAATAEEERRHLLGFRLYRRRVLGRRGALYADWCPGLARRIGREPHWARKRAALQAVAERAFERTLEGLRVSAPGPVLRALLDRVLADERRHCRDGEALEAHLPRDARDRLVLDVCRAMVGEFPAEVFARAGLDAGEASRLYRARPRRAAGRTFPRLLSALGPPRPASASARAALELL